MWEEIDIKFDVSLDEIQGRDTSSQLKVLVDGIKKFREIRNHLLEEKVEYQEKIERIINRNEKYEKEIEDMNKKVKSFEAELKEKEKQENVSKKKIQMAQKGHKNLGIGKCPLENEKKRQTKGLENRKEKLGN